MQKFTNFEDHFSQSPNAKFDWLFTQRPCIDSLYVMHVRTISWHRFTTCFLGLWQAFSDHCQNRVCHRSPITTSWMVFKWQYVCNHGQIKIHQTAFLYPSTNKTQIVWTVMEQMFLPGVEVPNVYVHPLMPCCFHNLNPQTFCKL